MEEWRNMLYSMKMGFFGFACNKKYCYLLLFVAYSSMSKRQLMRLPVR